MITKSLDELNELCYELMGAFVVVCTEPRKDGYVGVICMVDNNCIDCKETIAHHATEKYALIDALKQITVTSATYPFWSHRKAESMRCDN